MKEPIGGGFAGIVTQAAGAAFGLGSWSAGRRVAALVAVVRSFCAEATVCYRAREDGKISDAEARAIAEAAGRFVEDLEALTVELYRDTGSAYGLVIEYGGNRARNEGFVSDGATRRALQMVGNEADVGITILGFAGTG